MFFYSGIFIWFREAAGITPHWRGCNVPIVALGRTALFGSLYRLLVPIWDRDLDLDSEGSSRAGDRLEERDRVLRAWEGV